MTLVRPVGGGRKTCRFGDGRNRKETRVASGMKIGFIMEATTRVVCGPQSRKRGRIRK